MNTTQTRYVLCFDRDYTINVNPHPHRETVPLAWVQAWAHNHDNVDVWATGNQALADEARIPGRLTAAAAWDTAHPEQSVVDTHYTGTGYRTDDPVPTREDGLEIIDELYTTTNTPAEFIVIDDVDLTEFTDNHNTWTHMYPWDFYNHVTTHGEDPHSLTAPHTSEAWGDDLTDNQDVSFHRPAPLDDLGVNVWEHYTMHEQAVQSPYTRHLGMD